jgi:hypothetical protein
MQVTTRPDALLIDILGPKTKRGQIALLINNLETTISGKQRERTLARAIRKSKENTPSHDGS